MDLIKSITQEYERTDIPEFGIGDTVKVYIKVKEGNKERIHEAAATAGESVNGYINKLLAEKIPGFDLMDGGAGG